MSSFLLWLCIGVGGALGAFLPGLWGSEGLLLPTVLSTCGSLVGIWVWYRLLRFS